MMFSITGQLLKTFSEPHTNRDTGEQTMKHRIQLLGEIPIRDGSGSRYDMVTLNVDELRPYQEMQGKVIRVPFGFFSPGKGQVITFVPKGSKPQLATESA